MAREKQRQQLVGKESMNKWAEKFVFFLISSYKENKSQLKDFEFPESIAGRTW